MLIRLYGGRLLSVCLGKHRSTCQVAENDLLLGRPWGQSPIAIYVPSVSKKYKLANGTPRSFACPIMAPLQWGWFCLEGTVHFMSSSCEQIWKSIRNEHKIIAWSYWLYVYAEWLSKYSLRMRSGGRGEMSPRKSVVQSACQYEVTSCVSNFQNGEQSVHRRDG